VFVPYSRGGHGFAILAILLKVTNQTNLEEEMSNRSVQKEINQYTCDVCGKVVETEGQPNGWRYVITQLNIGRTGLSSFEGFPVGRIYTDRAFEDRGAWPLGCSNACCAEILFAMANCVKNDPSTYEKDKEHLTQDGMPDVLFRSGEPRS
jgi:hypothetical protein